MSGTGSNNESVSSCFPPSLTHFPTYTEGISDALTNQVNRLWTIVGDYLATSDPAYAPDPSAVVNEVDIWRQGLQQLGQWTAAVGKAYLEADLSGAANRLPGTAFPDQVLDSAIIHDLPPGYQSAPYLGVSGDTQINWQALMDQTDGNPEKNFVDLVNGAAGTMANDPANALAAKAGVFDVLAKNTLNSADLNSALEKVGSVFDGAGDVVAGVEGFQSQWKDNAENGTISLPVDVMTSTLHAATSVFGGLVGGEEGLTAGTAACGPVCGVVGAVLGTAFGGYIGDLGAANVLKPGDSSKSVAEPLEHPPSSNVANLTTTVEQSAANVASTDAGAGSPLPAVGSLPAAALIEPPSVLYPEQVSLPPSGLNLASIPGASGP
ncbi:MAG: hypothetical protein ACR2MN_06780 [Acidimicrobiales bacterium]